MILIMGGIFYAALRLMPNGSTIDVQWMSSQIKPGMDKDQVRQTIGGDPSYVVKSGLGQDETWYYNDRYRPDTTHLAIQFIDGHVYQSQVEGPVGPN